MFVSAPISSSSQIIQSSFLNRIAMPLTIASPPPLDPEDLQELNSEDFLSNLKSISTLNSVWWERVERLPMKK
jgi:hypothetical protein